MFKTQISSNVRFTKKTIIEVLARKSTPPPLLLEKPTDTSDINTNLYKIINQLIIFYS